MVISDDDGDGGSGEQPFVRRKIGRDSIVFSALEAAFASGEDISDRALKRSRSLDPDAFHSFASTLGVVRPFLYVSQLNANNPPRYANIPHPFGHIYISSWEYRREQGLMDPKVVIPFF
ncbi:unnamed protein product [Lactuca saligna]|uniref:Uncharacterized protein n=1 Tax=Lactuca saligna TaxID=75948 RepID=A0AA36EGN2_LACSI|nr:unnamed protein product [Lactuca saligna]